MQYTNSKHPECLEGEVWVTNTNIHGYDTCSHTTKRLGRIAYDIWNNLVIGSYPMFASKVELESKGFIFPKSSSYSFELDIEGFLTTSTKLKRLYHVQP